MTNEAKSLVVSINNNTMIFHLSNGNNISCTCIKDEYAKAIAKAVQEQAREIERMRAELAEAERMLAEAWSALSTWCDADQAADTPQLMRELCLWLDPARKADRHAARTAESKETGDER